MAEAGKFLDDSHYKKILKQTSGLGTSATRDSIIENLKYKGFIENDGKYIKSTKKGRDLIAYLPPELYDIARTAKWEAELDVVAAKGGGAALEALIAKEAINMVAILKSYGRMQRSEKPITPSKEKTAMSENQEQSTGKPTEKMVEFATKIAKALNQPLPEAVSSNFDTCKEYIDSNKAAASKPSEKQLKYAESIALKKGLTIPDDVKADSREMSKWIDEHKA